MSQSRVIPKARRISRCIALLIVSKIAFGIITARTQICNASHMHWRSLDAHLTLVRSFPLPCFSCGLLGEYQTHGSRKGKSWVLTLAHVQIVRLKHTHQCTLTLPIISALDLKAVKSLTILGKRKQCMLSRRAAFRSIKFPIEAPK